MDSACTVAMLIIVDWFWCDLTMHCVFTWCLYCSYHLRVFFALFGVFYIAFNYSEPSRVFYLK